MKLKKEDLVKIIKEELDAVVAEQRNVFTPVPVIDQKTDPFRKGIYKPLPGREVPPTATKKYNKAGWEGAKEESEESKPWYRSWGPWSLEETVKEELDSILSELGFGEGKPAPDELSKKRVVYLEEEEELEEDEKKKTKVSKSGQKRVSKKIGHLVGKEGKSQEQSAAIAYSMENRGELKKGGKHSVG